MKKYKALGEPQAIDFQMDFFYRNLLKIDTDEVLKKAGVNRQGLSALLYDDEIDQAIDRRRQSLINSRYFLTPSNGKVAEFIFAELDKWLPDILNASFDSRLYGYDVAEMLWEFGAVNRVKSITSKPIEWFNINNTGEVYYYPNNNQPPIAISKQDDYIYRYLVQVNEPKFKQPLGKSILSRVYWLWYFKINGFRFWSKFLERFGSPLLVGKADISTDEEELEFTNALLSAHNSGILTLGANDDLQAIGGNGNGEAFDLYNQTITKRITTYLLGQTLTSGTDKGGTYGQGVIHQEQQQIIFDSDKVHAKKAVQRFIDVVCLANGWQAPKFEWVSNKGLQAERANRDKVLHEQGVRFTQAYYADVYDLEESHFYLFDDKPKEITVLNQTRASSNNIKSPFTPEQQRLENVADMALNEPIFADFGEIIANAKDEKELFENLCRADFGGVDEVQAMMSIADLYGFMDGAK